MVWTRTIITLHWVTAALVVGLANFRFFHDTVWFRQFLPSVSNLSVTQIHWGFGLSDHVFQIVLAMESSGQAATKFESIGSLRGRVGPCLFLLCADFDANLGMAICFDQPITNPDTYLWSDGTPTCIVAR